MRWLHRFFYSDDPDVKIAGGLSEFDAGIAVELLRNEGIMAMTKGMNFLSLNWGGAQLIAPNHFALWVKQSDAWRAIEALELVLTPKQLARRHRRLRRRQ